MGENLGQRGNLKERNRGHQGHDANEERYACTKERHYEVEARRRARLRLHRDAFFAKFYVILP